MSTDAKRATAKKAEADKKAAEDAAAATKAAASAWPTKGYNSFIPLLIIFILAVLAVCVDLSTVCLVRACLDQSQYVINLVNAMLVIYSWINLIEKLPIYSTIQKPIMCRNFSASGFAAALKPDKFTGTYFKRWQTKTTLWLTAMNVFWVTGVSTGTIAPEQEKAFKEATVVFLGAVLSVIGDKLVDAYLHVHVAKDLWEALESKFGAADAGSEMYIIEQFHDYKMVENRPVLEQAHEIICIVKELELLKCELPGKFVAGCIIAKLPNSWRNFATTLKHQRREFSVEDVIGHLSVEQNSRAKDSHGKGAEGTSVANMVNQRNFNSHKFKGKNGVQQNTDFKKKGKKTFKKNKKDEGCFTCGSTEHWANRCPNKFKKSGQDSKSVNMIVSNNENGASGYGNLFTVFSVFQPTDWWVDTGAGVHVCADISLFTSYQVTGHGSLLMGNGASASVHGVGTVDLKFTSGRIVQLKNVQHVPAIKKNLVSGSLLCREGFKLVFESNKLVVTKYGLFVGKGYESGGMFRLSLADFCNKVVNHIHSNVNESEVWHSRLCHISFGVMTRLAKLDLIPSFTLAKGSKCLSCVQAKQPRKPHKAAEERHLAPLELIHSDLCEMNGVLTKGGKRYFMTLIDDSTRYCYVYLLNTKDEALHYFKIYKAEVENQLEKKIKRVRSDRGGEYFSSEFDSFCAEHGIIHERTPPYSPQSNGVAERKNRTLTDLVNAMLDTSGLSKAWWGEAILTACHVLNKVPTKDNEITPYEKWAKRRTTLSYLRTWGCLAKVNVPIPKKRKLGHKTVDCINLGYAKNSVGYRFLVVKSEVPDQKIGTIMESKDATFFEDIFPMRDMQSTSRQESEETPEPAIPMEYYEQTHDENPEEDDEETLGRGKRQRTAKTFGDDFFVYLVDDTPTSISEAYASPEADYWKDAVRSEMDSIMANGTWEITDRPYGCKPLGCKWVFKKKLRPDGTIEKYKARLVAKGYDQQEEEDFFDTYSPVARLTTIRVLLSLAASHGLLVHQMDVKTAFLNGELKEEIYMQQPDGFVIDGQERKVCRLIKSLYGLKQAPKQWHDKFNTTLTSVGFVVNEADKCVYYRHGGGEGVILCLYVDDILIFGTNLKVIEEVKSFLSQNFEMKDLGVADVILNIKLLRDNEGGITLLQSHYVEKVLSRFGYSDCTPSQTPYDPSVLIRKSKGMAKDQLRYSQIIGSLMYLASATRPDIAFAVSKLSRFVSKPGDVHWHAVERVMRYLKGTMNYGLHYTGYPSVLEGYSDANWISDADEMKATTGYMFTLGGGAVSWKSCKQTILTRSTMEAELTALDTSGVEARWLRDLLMDLPLVDKPVPAILMNCDNQTVITKVKSSKDNMKSTKHIRMRLKAVRKLRNSGVIALDYVHTAKNLADPFTKGLSRVVIDNASREMGMRPT